MRPAARGAAVEFALSCRIYRGHKEVSPRYRTSAGIRDALMQPAK